MDAKRYRNTIHHQFANSFERKLASLAKWLSVCLRIKSFWVGFQLQSLEKYHLIEYFNDIRLSNKKANLLMNVGSKANCYLRI